MFPNQFQNPGGYYYPPPQHHGQASHHGQTPGIIPIMYNVKGANTNQDFQHQSNTVMLPPSGPQQQYRFQAPSQPQPPFIYVQTPSAMPGTPNSCPDSGTTNTCQSESTDDCSSLNLLHQVLLWKKIPSPQLLQLTPKVL